MNHQNRPPSGSQQAQRMLGDLLGHSKQVMDADAVLLWLTWQRASSPHTQRRGVAEEKKSPNEIPAIVGVRWMGS
jgi:hypothetical protein